MYPAEESNEIEKRIRSILGEQAKRAGAYVGKSGKKLGRGLQKMLKQVKFTVSKKDADPFKWKMI